MAAKVKDGLFIGDAESSQDPEFLELNKIFCLINCAGKQIPNVYAGHGLSYKRLDWDDTQDHVLIDSNGVVLQQIVDFIDQSLAHGNSVLVFSLRGVSRCVACVTAYLMFKYHWGFEKTISYMFNKRPDIDINMGFVQQLQRLDRSLQLERSKTETRTSHEITRKRLTSWDPSYLLDTKHAPPGTDDETVLVHSFLNSQQQLDMHPPRQLAPDEKRVMAIRWDEVVNVDWLDMKTVHAPNTALVPVRPIMKGSRQLYVSGTVTTVAEDKRATPANETQTRSAKAEEAKPPHPVGADSPFYHLLVKDDKHNAQSSPDLYENVGVARTSDANGSGSPDRNGRAASKDQRADNHSEPKASSHQGKDAEAGVKSTRPTSSDIYNLSSSLNDLKFADSSRTPSTTALSPLEDLATREVTPSYPSQSTSRPSSQRQTAHEVALEDYQTLYGGDAQQSRPSSRTPTVAWAATNTDTAAELGKMQRSQRSGPVRVERAAVEVPSTRDSDGQMQARGRQSTGPVRARPASPAPSDGSIDIENHRVPAAYRHGSPAPQGFRRSRTSGNRVSTSTRTPSPGPESSTRPSSTTRVRPPSPARSGVANRRLSGISTDSTGIVGEPLKPQRAPSPSPVEQSLGGTTRTPSARKARPASPMTRSASSESNLSDANAALSGRSSTPSRRWRL